MNCEIIMDLIPMYADKTASRDTVKLIDHHIENCPECRRFLYSCKKTEKKCAYSKKQTEKLREKLSCTEADIPSVDAEFVRLSKRLKKRKLRRILISAALAMGMLVYIIADISLLIKKNGDKK